MKTVFGMVIDNVDLFGLWSRSATLLLQSKYRTCYCQYIHDTLL